VKLIRIPIECVIQITESFKIAYDILLEFVTDLHEMV